MAPDDKDKQSLSLVTVHTQAYNTHPLAIPRPHTADPQFQRPQAQDYPALSSPSTSDTPGTRRKMPSLAPASSPGQNSLEPKASLYTHPALLLPRDDDPLKFPFQYRIALPRTPVTLSLSLFLVEPMRKEDRRG